MCTDRCASLNPTKHFGSQLPFLCFKMSAQVAQPILEYFFDNQYKPAQLLWITPVEHEYIDFSVL